MVTRIRITEAAYRDERNVSVLHISFCLNRKPENESPIDLGIASGRAEGKLEGGALSSFPHGAERGKNPREVPQEGKRRSEVSFKPRARGRRRGGCGSVEANMLAIARNSFRASPIIAAADVAGGSNLTTAAAARDAGLRPWLSA